MFTRGLATAAGAASKKQLTIGLISGDGIGREVIPVEYCLSGSFCEKALLKSMDCPLKELNRHLLIWILFLILARLHHKLWISLLLENSNSSISMPDLNFSKRLGSPYQKKRWREYKTNAMVLFLVNCLVWFHQDKQHCGRLANIPDQWNMFVITTYISRVIYKSIYREALADLRT